MKKRTKAIIRAAISVTELGVLVYVIRKEGKLKKKYEDLYEDYDAVCGKFARAEIDRTIKSRILEEIDYLWNASMDTEELAEVLTRMKHRNWFQEMNYLERNEILGKEE